MPTFWRMLDVRIILRETWLSLKARPHAFDVTLGLLALPVLATFFYLQGLAGWMPATREAVFTRGELWRPWTALLAHADLGHLLSNSLLFVPFSFFLLGFFPRWFFPVLAFLEGGLVSLAALLTMEPGARLLGMSGVVHWMGAAWLTLYLLIEKRDRPRTRIGKAVLVTAAVFLPDTLRGDVSYVSHYLGFALGALSALVLYRIERARYVAAERREVVVIEDGIEEGEWTGAELSGSPAPPRG